MTDINTYNTENISDSFYIAKDRVKAAEETVEAANYAVSYINNAKIEAEIAYQTSLDALKEANINVDEIEYHLNKTDSKLDTDYILAIASFSLLETAVKKAEVAAINAELAAKKAKYASILAYESLDAFKARQAASTEESIISRYMLEDNNIEETL